MIAKSNYTHNTRLNIPYVMLLHPQTKTILIILSVIKNTDSSTTSNLGVILSSSTTYNLTKKNKFKIITDKLTLNSPTFTLMILLKLHPYPMNFTKFSTTLC